MSKSRILFSSTRRLFRRYIKKIKNVYVFTLPVCDMDRGQFLPAYSSYLEQLSAGYGDIPDEDESSSGFGILIQFCIALTILVLVLLMGMCVLNKYLKHARQGGEEIISLRNSFR